LRLCRVRKKDEEEESLVLDLSNGDNQDPPRAPDEEITDSANGSILEAAKGLHDNDRGEEDSSRADTEAITLKDDFDEIPDMISRIDAAIASGRFDQYATAVLLPLTEEASCTKEEILASLEGRDQKPVGRAVNRLIEHGVILQTGRRLKITPPEQWPTVYLDRDVLRRIDRILAHHQSNPNHVENASPRRGSDPFGEERRRLARQAMIEDRRTENSRAKKPSPRAGRLRPPGQPENPRRPTTIQSAMGYSAGTPRPMRCGAPMPSPRRGAPMPGLDDEEDEQDLEPRDHGQPTQIENASPVLMTPHRDEKHRASQGSQPDPGAPIPHSVTSWNAVVARASIVFGKDSGQKIERERQDILGRIGGRPDCLLAAIAKCEDDDFRPAEPIGFLVKIARQYRDSGIPDWIDEQLAKPPRPIGSGPLPSEKYPVKYFRAADVERPDPNDIAPLGIAKSWREYARANGLPVPAAPETTVARGAQVRADTAGRGSRAACPAGSRRPSRDGRVSRRPDVHETGQLRRRSIGSWASPDSIPALALGLAGGGGAGGRN
jgi:hypothetical protein